MEATQEVKATQGLKATHGLEATQGFGQTPYSLVLNLERTLWF